MPDVRARAALVGAREDRGGAMKAGVIEDVRTCRVTERTYEGSEARAIVLDVTIREQMRPFRFRMDEQTATDCVRAMATALGILRPGQE